MKLVVKRIVLVLTVLLLTGCSFNDVLQGLADMTPFKINGNEYTKDKYQNNIVKDK